VLKHWPVVNRRSEKPDGVSGGREWIKIPPDEMTNVWQLNRKNVIGRELGIYFTATNSADGLRREC